MISFLSKHAYQADELDIALRKVGLELSKSTELSGASRGEVVGVGEEDAVGVADVLVEVDLALGGDGLEVGGLRSETETGGRSAVQLRCQLPGEVTYGVERCS